MDSHGEAGPRHPGTQSLSNARKLPEASKRACLVPEHMSVSYVMGEYPEIRPVQNAWPEGADVGAGTDTEKDYSEQRLEVEKGGHAISETINSQVHVDEVESIIGQNYFLGWKKNSSQQKLEHTELFQEGRRSTGLICLSPSCRKILKALNNRKVPSRSFFSSDQPAVLP